jgi:hypothetical protein
MQAAVAARQVEHFQATRAELAQKLMAATENGRQGRAVARKLMQAEQELSSHMVQLAELKSQIAGLAPFALHPEAEIVPAPAPARAPKNAEAPRPRAQRKKKEPASSTPKNRVEKAPKRGKSPRCTTCEKPASAPEPLPADDQAELARLVNEFAQGEADEIEQGGV